MSNINQNINFYKPPFRREKKKFDASVAVICIASVCALLIGSSQYLDWELDKDKTIIAGKKLVTNDLVAKADVLKLKIETKNKNHREKIDSQFDIVKKINDELKNRLEVYAQTAGNLHVNNVSTYYAALGKQAVEGLWLEEFNLSPAAGNFTITGKSIKPGLVPQYVAKLTQDEAFFGINFHSAEIINDDESNSINFTLTSSSGDYVDSSE